MENQPPPPIAVLSQITQWLNAIRCSGQHDIPNWLWDDMMRLHSEAVQSLDHARAQRDAA